MPYKDSILISAQALSIVAFFFSLVSFGFLPGLVAFVLFQVVWCCSMSRCGLITAGVFGLLAWILSIIGGILLLTTSAGNYSFWFSSCTNTINGVTYDCTTTTTTDSGPFTAGAVISFIGAACWIASAVCVFVFVNSGRFDKCIEAQLDDIIIPGPTQTKAVVELPQSPSRDTTQVEYVEDLDIESPPATGVPAVTYSSSKN